MIWIYTHIYIYNARSTIDRRKEKNEKNAFPLKDHSDKSNRESGSDPSPIMDLLGRLGNRPICWPRTRTTRLPYRITMEHPFFTNSRSVSASDNHFYFNRLWSTIHRRSVCACRPKQSRGNSFLLFPVASRKSSTRIHRVSMMYEFLDRARAWAKRFRIDLLDSCQEDFCWISLCAFCGGACGSKNAADPSLGQAC